MFNRKYEALMKEFETLSIEFENYKKSVNYAASELPMLVDFETMKVVSIERIVKNGQPCTVLGYISPNGPEIYEWVLFCSDSNHIVLIEQFKKYMSGK